MEGRVAAKTLEGWNFGEKSMREFADSALEAERRKLDKRLVVLSTLGNNTPFIGLLGTVLGIMKAFRDLAMAGDAGPAVVMKGISEALIATAFGLGVAVPCVIAFNIFSKMAKGKVSNAQEIVDMLTGIRAAFETKGLPGVVDYAKDARSNKDGKLILDEKHQPQTGQTSGMANETA
jgi:biopolymer transport protein ExbB